MRSPSPMRRTGGEVYREHYGELPPFGQGGTPETAPEQFQLRPEEMTPHMRADRQRWRNMPDDVLIWRENERIVEAEQAAAEEEHDAAIRRISEDYQGPRAFALAEIEIKKKYVAKLRAAQDKYNASVHTPGCDRDSWKIVQGTVDDFTRRARERGWC